MNNPFSLDARMVRRVICAMLATLMFVSAVPALFMGRAAANPSQLQSRSIQMSDSGPSGTSIPVGTVGSGTSVTYRVSFTTIGTAASVVIDFCKEDPIIGDTCTAPNGMVTSGVGLATVASGGNIQSSGWTVASSSAGHIVVAQGTGSAATAGAQQFDLTGITNPSAAACASGLACTFYARIYTYSVTDPTTATPNAYAGPTSPGSYVDYGGIALSTATTIQITARVQEQLTFCVSNAAPDTGWLTPNVDDCSASQVASNPPIVTLGQSVGAGQPVLDPSRIDTGTIYSQVSTNATHGAVIDMRNNNTSCGGLSADNGTTCAIPPVNSGANTGAAITAGVAAFGMCSVTYPDAGDATIVGSMTPQAPYITATHDCNSGTPFYGMDASGTTPSNGGSPATNLGNVESTFGSIVAATTSPVHHADNKYVFAATPSLTTPAGIYTANMSMIATGTF